MLRGHRDLKVFQLLIALPWKFSTSQNASKEKKLLTNAQIGRSSGALLQTWRKLSQTRYQTCSVKKLTEHKCGWISLWIVDTCLRRVMII